MSTEKWNLVIDVALCENCNNCVLAAKDELVGNTFPGYSAPHAAQGRGVIHIERHVRGAAPMVDVAHRPVMCNHCDAAPCLTAGADGSVVKRADGIVLIDPGKAKGRRDLVEACPYGAIVWNEAEQLPQTWFFDAHLLDAGASAPRCAGVCPTQAIEAVKCSDAAMADRARRDDLMPLRPELGTRPRVYYRHHERFERLFVGGSVEELVGGVLDCVAGASVQLLRQGQTVAQSETDVFGDFRFDGLAPGGGVLELRVSHAQHGQAAVSVELSSESLVLGAIRLVSPHPEAADSRERT